MVVAGSADHRNVSTQGTPSAVCMQCMLWRTLRRCDGHPFGLGGGASHACDGAWAGRRLQAALHSFEGFIMGHAQPSGINCGRRQDRAGEQRLPASARRTADLLHEDFGLRLTHLRAHAPVQMWQGVSPVLVQMWQR